MVILFQSTHPTRGCDRMERVMKSFRLFQSTHPTRGCDRAAQRSFASGFRFQSTHPTRGCDGYGKSGIHRLDISIHAPHEGVRRLGYAKDYVRQIHFNPRTPRGGATITRMIVDNLLSISIHAPHEGVRRLPQSIPQYPFHFNPRTPRGGATQSAC